MQDLQQCRKQGRRCPKNPLCTQLNMTWLQQQHTVLTQQLGNVLCYCKLAGAGRMAPAFELVKQTACLCRRVKGRAAGGHHAQRCRV